MLFSTSGNPPADFQSPKKQPKSPPLGSSVRSFLSQVTSMRRSLAVVVIFFQVLLGLYLTRTFHISRPHSPKPSPEVIQAGESRIALDVSSKMHTSNTYDSLPTKEEVLSSTSNTFDSLQKNKVRSTTSNSFGSLPKDKLPSITSNTFGSSSDDDEVPSTTSNTVSGLPKGKLPSTTSNTFGILSDDEVPSTRSKTFDSLPDREVPRTTFNTFSNLPEEVPRTTFNTFSNLPEEVPRTTSNTFSNLLENDEVPSTTSKTFGSLRNKKIPSTTSNTFRNLPENEVPSTTSKTFDSLPDKEVTKSNTFGSLRDKAGLSTTSNTFGSLPKDKIPRTTSFGSLRENEVQSATSNSFGSSLLKKVQKTTSKGSLPENGCDSGRIYVYDLPPMFNQDLLTDCNELDPWHNKCNKNLNGGLGPEATELANIVPKSVLPAWHWTDVFWGEVMYHNRMLNYNCRTLEPESATAFYIPFYAGLAVSKYLWGNHTGRDRDQHCEMLIKWVQRQKWWNRSNGSDHFIMLGRITWDFRRLREAVGDWGSSFIHMPEMKNVIRLSVERDQWDNLEIAVPYPTTFHPRSESDITEWQKFVRSRRRNHLFTFVGSGRKSNKNDFRRILMNQCLNKAYVCRHVDCDQKSCTDGTTAVMEAFLDSSFCLQPRGNGFTRRSVFDCMLAGSIPVFFWKRTAYLQYKLFLPSEPDSYSVFIHRDDVRNGTNIRKVLRGYGRDEVRRMREKVIEHIPRFVYAKTTLGLENSTDAFDIAMDGVLEKIQARGSHGES